MKLLLLATSTLFTTSLCNAKNDITFQPIEAYTIHEEHTDELESFEDLFRTGNNLFKKEQYDNAAFYYKRALKVNPTCSHTSFNLGQSYYWAKNYQKALKYYKKTIRNNPGHARAYAQIGRLFFDVKQYNDTIIPLQKSLELDETNTETRLLLARMYNQQQLYDKALKTLNVGLALSPDDINLQFEKANTLNTINRLEEALSLYYDLDKKAPNNPSIIYNIAFTLKKLGRVTESIPYYNKTLELKPHHSDAWFSRGLAYLVLGDFEKGWEGYEWRYHKPENGSLRSYTQPRWNGKDDISGKTILIHSEQGLGDTFQFIRYAQLLKNKNATVIAAVQKPLVTLIGLCPYIDKVVAITDETMPEFDTHAPIMSLPHALHTRIDTIPTEIPYLFADETLTQEWHNKLATDTNFKIGICWQGNDNYATPNLRTAVALKSVQADEFAPICAIPGVSVYSLQKTTGTDQLKNLPKGINIISFDGDFDNSHGRFMDTAAVMKNLDLVITVDTSISHLSSALGTPTWVMLPNPADWRWMIDRTDSPWYPNVMRLFKQPTPGDWKTMIAEVAKELEKYITKK
jgi:tetratricopeptide (TPR) repeat protein